MISNPEAENKTPIIVLDKTGVDGASIFNPNNWRGLSKPIVHSCWAEYSSLVYSENEITKICEDSLKYCKNHIQDIQNQWSLSHFDLNRVEIFSHVPALHAFVENFFNSSKSLLDLLAQILSSEKIVNGLDIHGFHKKNGVMGGNLLNALERNISEENKTKAGQIRQLIVEQKTAWIDQSISFRDNFTHPEKGMFQIMFRLEFEKDGENLNLKNIIPPMVGEQSIDFFVRKQVSCVKQFSLDYLKVF